MTKTPNKLEKINKCPVCSCEKQVAIFGVKDKLTFVREIFPLVKCTVCGLYYLQKRPTKKNIGSYYPDVYEPYNIDKYDFYVELQNTLMTSYLKKNKKIIDHLLGFFYQSIYGCLPPFEHKKIKVLDIGCGNGSYIYSLKKRGMDVYGVDFSEKSVNFAKNILKLENVEQADVEKISYPSSFFDVIVMNHVIEHVYNPKGLFEKAAKFLKKDGTLIVATPNTDAVNFSLFGKDWFPLEAPRHLTLFNPASMSRLAQESGLRIKNIFHDRSSHALQRSIGYKYGINLSVVKILLIPLTIIFSLLGKSDIATYHIVKYTHSEK